VVTITIAWLGPVRQTMRTRSGLNVRTPMTMSRPASAGIAMAPARSPNSRMTTAITAAAVMFARRVRAPAVVTRDVADIDPPTGMPWRSPEAMFATPWPRKSPEASG